MRVKKKQESNLRKRVSNKSIKLSKAYLSIIFQLVESVFGLHDKMPEKLLDPKIKSPIARSAEKSGSKKSGMKSGQTSTLAPPSHTTTETTTQFAKSSTKSTTEKPYNRFQGFWNLLCSMVFSLYS